MAIPKIPDDLPNMIASLLTDEDKVKAPDVNEILLQYHNNRITISEASEMLQNTLGNGESVKLEEIMKSVVNGNVPIQVANNSNNNININNNNRPPTLPGFRKKARTWTQEEDQRLLDAIQANGVDNWPLVATLVGGNRTRSQCSQRWHRVLDPKIAKSNWTREEEEKLLNAVQAYGSKAWTRIASEIGNRSDVQCRFRYKFLIKKAKDNKTDLLPVSASLNQLGRNDINIPNLHINDESIINPIEITEAGNEAVKDN